MNQSAPDLTKAYTCLTQAHDAGDARATYALGTWYLHGKSPIVKRNRVRARTYLTLAAGAGIADAMYDLAVFYERGEIGKPDLRKAFELYLSAALRNELQSVYEVGRCYHYGVGVKSDARLAKIWLDRAGELDVVS